RDYPQYDEVKNNIHFTQGDACNLAEKFTDYDLVFAGNLIDRLYDPSQFLSLMKNRIRAGGLLVITSPYTWLENFTNREKWLGGFKASTGENYSTLEGIRDKLAPEFTQLGEACDVPFVIRETKRKFQHSVAQLSIWKKNH
ncbi:MAG: putative 4-mercaptohistidine N1-methyltransferase, partial [Rickettsiales bacterium]